MQSKQRYRCAARMDSLSGLLGKVGECARAEGLNEQRLPGLELALEEAFVNICRHAYRDGGGEVEVGCGSEDGHFVVELTDYGRPFTSSSQPAPPLDQALAERQPGGIGLYLIKRMTDDYGYHRQGRTNTTKLVFKLPGCGEPAA